MVLFLLTRDKAADLPRLESWSGETEEIVLKKSGETIRLFRSDGTWLIGEAAYPADAQAVAGLEEKMKTGAVGPYIDTGALRSLRPR